MSRDVLLTNSGIGILGYLMLPVAHQGAPRPRVELSIEIAIVDCKMVTAIQRCRDAGHPASSIRADVYELSFGKREIQRFLDIALEFLEVAGDVDFSKNSVASNDPADGKGIEEFVRKDTSRKAA